MEQKREQTIFLAILWCFLVGSLIFFTVRLSAGALFLPAPVWYLLLLLDAGFVVFLFVPHAGRAVRGVPGRYEETLREHRWYPTTLPEIVDGRPGGAPAPEGLRPPSRAVAPVPLLPLLLLLVVIALAYPAMPPEETWKTRETERLREVYARVCGEVSRVETLADGLAAEAAELVRRAPGAAGSAAERAALMIAVDSLAREARLGAAGLPEPGIQVFGATGERLVWGGSPRHLEAARPGEAEAPRTFSARAPLYTLLVREIASPDSGRIVVDVPVEVNYRINNRFLESTSLGELLTRRLGAEIDLNFAMGEPRGAAAWRAWSNARDTVIVTSSPHAGIQVLGAATASTGLPLARVRITGGSYAAAAQRRQAARALWARLAVSLAAAAIAVWIYWERYKRVARERGRLGVLARRAIVLAAFVAGLRYLLLRLDVPNALVGTPVFDPVYFADAVPGGFLRSAGDFLITAVFGLILVFGVIKAFRTYYPGRLERSLGRSLGRASAPRAAVKAAIVCAALAGSLWISAEAVRRGVVNAASRLVGLDVSFFDPTVVALHLSFLFAISAALIAALFVIRLALVWGEARLSEGIAAAAVALAACAWLAAARVIPWPLAAAAAAIVALSFRIFPLLRKEETVSVVFASFFLVLAATAIVYGASEARYARMRSDFVRNRAENFTHPEDNVVRFQLPDVCGEMSRTPALIARVRARSESSAFELWAESMLSRLGLSCSVEVFDAAGESISRFAVGMPLDLPRVPPGPDDLREGAEPRDERMATKEGDVYYYVAYAPAREARGTTIGWAEITVPYFFENPRLLARTGPMAPEILRNIDRGAPAPRRDEPENLLVARLSNGRVAESSDAGLRPGTPAPAGPGERFRARVGRDRYDGFVSLRDDGEGYLVAFRQTSAGESLLQWATIVSLDVILALVSLLALFVARRLPVLRGVVPSVSPLRAPGFRQKVLLSFLAVSMLPVVVLGAFSSQVIQRRFRADSESEAVSRASAAVSLLNHSIRSEAAAFTVNEFTGGPVAGDASETLRPEELALVAASSNVGQVTIAGERSGLFGVVASPAGGRAAPAGHLFYRRRLDDAFMKSVAEALGSDINIYYGPTLGASSERELFVGGFLDRLIDPTVFVDVVLRRSPVALRRETLGDYSYYVASAPLPALGPAGSAVLSVPMLYEPIAARAEMRRTFTLVLGLLALLLAATVTLGVFLAGSIFNPIAALQGGTRRIIEGDLEFKLESKAPDEIGELVSSFNTMTAALRDTRRDLLERQRYLAAVLDNVATGVMAIDREGRVTTLNPSGERILRLSAAAILGKRGEEVFGGGLEALGALVAGPGEEVREAEVGLFSGEEARTVKAVVASLVEGGERLGTVVVFDDLTELIKSKKLGAWVEMARQIAHEVKNPLTPIKLSAQLMRKAYEARSPDFDGIFRSGIDTMVQQTEILRRIATEFSSFGRATRLVPETVPLREFLDGVVASYRGSERVAVTLEAPDGIRVTADREALRRIVVNLVENAVEATPGSGTVAVSSSRDGDRARIVVRDSGTGLSAEMQARLFEPYFSTKTNGIGLGLAISQSLARAMNGEVTLRNRADGPGVEATVLVPLAKEA